MLHNTVAVLRVATNFYLFILFIMKIVHIVQVKRKQIQTEKKTQKYRHTHKKMKK